MKCLEAGDAFEVVQNEKAMKQIVTERKQQERINRLEAMAVSHVKKRKHLQMMKLKTLI